MWLIGEGLFVFAGVGPGGKSGSAWKPGDQEEATHVKLLTRTELLARIKELEQENKELEQENEALRERLDDISDLASEDQEDGEDSPEAEDDEGN